MKVCLFIILAFLVGCIQSPGEPKLESMGLIKPVEYSVSGTLSGLSGSSIILKNSNELLSVTQNGSFRFATKQGPNSAYNVTIDTMPTGQNCLISGSSGTVTADISSIQVKCSTASRFLISGSLSGVDVAGLELTLKNGTIAVDYLVLEPGSNSFIFNDSLPNNTAYTVEITQSPSGRFCYATQNTGTIASANVTNISISCVSTGSVFVSGRVTGLANGEFVRVAANAESGGKEQVVTATVGDPQPTYSFPISVNHRAVLELTNSTTSKYCVFSQSKINKFASQKVTSDLTDIDIACYVRDAQKCQRHTKTNQTVSSSLGTAAACAGGNLYFTGQGFVGDYIGTAFETSLSNSTLTLPPTYDRFNGLVNVAIPDGAGGWYVGGNFTRVGNLNYPYLVHLFSDSTVDENFKVKPNREVYDIYLDGTSLYIAGAFQTIIVNDAASVERKGIARLDLTSTNAVLHPLSVQFTNTTFSNASTANGRVNGIIADNTKLYFVGDNLSLTLDYLGSVDKNGEVVTPTFSALPLSYAVETRTYLTLATDNTGEEFLWYFPAATSGQITKIRKSDLSVIASLGSIRYTSVAKTPDYIFATSTGGLWRIDYKSATPTITNSYSIGSYTGFGDVSRVAYFDGNLCLSGTNMVISSTNRGSLFCLNSSNTILPVTTTDRIFLLNGQGNRLFSQSQNTVRNETQMCSGNAGLMRLNASTGNIDTSFCLTASTIMQMEAKGDFLYLGGNFTSLSGNSLIKKIARYNYVTNTLDTNFRNTFIDDKNFRSLKALDTELAVHTATTLFKVPFADPQAVPTYQLPVTSTTSLIQATSDLLLLIGNTYRISDLQTPYGSCPTTTGKIAPWGTGAFIQGTNIIDSNCNVTGTVPISGVVSEWNTCTSTTRLSCFMRSSGTTRDYFDYSVSPIIHVENDAVFFRSTTTHNVYDFSTILFITNLY